VAAFSSRTAQYLAKNCPQHTSLGGSLLDEDLVNFDLKCGANKTDTMNAIPTC